jgi:hypothetical protein
LYFPAGKAAREKLPSAAVVDSAVEVPLSRTLALTIGVPPLFFTMPRHIAEVLCSWAKSDTDNANTSIRISPEEHRVLLEVRPIVFSNSLSAL